MRPARARGGGAARAGVGIARVQRAGRAAGRQHLEPVAGGGAGVLPSFVSSPAPVWGQQVAFAGAAKEEGAGEGGKVGSPLAVDRVEGRGCLQ